MTPEAHAQRATAHLANQIGELTMALANERAAAEILRGENAQLQAQVADLTGKLGASGAATP